MNDINNKEYKICPCCGEKVSNGKFCPECGASLTKVSESSFNKEQIKTLDSTSTNEQQSGFYQSSIFGILKPNEVSEDEITLVQDVQSEEHQPVDDSELTLVGEFCKKTVATVGGDGYDEIVLYKNEEDGSFQIHTYSKYVYMQKERHHSFKAKPGAYDALLELVNKLHLDEYEGKRGVGLCGGMYICKYKKDGLIHRVSTDNCGTDGTTIINQVGKLLASYKGEEITK